MKDSLPITEEDFRGILASAIDDLDVESARREVEPFVRDPLAMSVWSKDFFRDVVGRIIPI